MDDFVKKVRAYALDNYDTDGWDYVVEAWEDKEIIEYYERAGGNEKVAFNALASFVKAYHGYAEDIRNA